MITGTKECYAWRRDFNQREIEEDGILNVNLNSFKETKNLPGLKNGLLVDIDDLLKPKKKNSNSLRN